MGVDEIDESEDENNEVLIDAENLVWQELVMY